jgi:uncharacterized protein
MNRGLEVRKNNKGRGVYATRHFARGDVIDDCPVLVMPYLSRTHITDSYAWSWQQDQGLCLGISSLFNHSPKPNTSSRRFYPQRRMVFRALRCIRAGEEILIDYGSTWFEVLP